MVLCLFVYFLAVNFDWSIILIRKSFRASRHISGKLGVKLAIDESRSLNCLRVLNLITTKGVKNKLAKDRSDHCFFITSYPKTSVNKCRTSVDSCV